jgi:hypothetical protein
MPYVSCILETCTVMAATVLPEQVNRPMRLLPTEALLHQP